ncbi:hypothetical protein BGX27_001460, partial [Mortierella sp. AM989]
TPAIFGSLTRTVGSSMKSRQQIAGTCSRPVGNDENVCTSPGRIVQDTTLSLQPVHRSGQAEYQQEVNSHCQSRQHPLHPHQTFSQSSQGNLSNQFTQHENHRHSAHPYSNSRLGRADEPQISTSGFNKAIYNSSEHTENLQIGHTMFNQDTLNPFFMDQQQQQQQYERTRWNVKEQQSVSGVGWDQSNSVEIHRPLLCSQIQHVPIQEMQQLTCQPIHANPLSSPDGKAEQRLQRYSQPMKVEPIDDDAFDSSLAMVLDDHLSLMDHLNMIPEAEVYSENSTLPTLPQFKQEDSALQSRFSRMVPKSFPSENAEYGHIAPNNHGAPPTSTMFLGLAGSAPSESAVVVPNSNIIDPGNSTKHGPKRNNDLMFYFNAPEALQSRPGLSQNTPFTYANSDFLQIKVEPGFEHQQQCKHTNSNTLHYALERQHPFDPSPMSGQQQQQCERQSFNHENPMLNAEYCYRPLQ